MQRTKSVGWWFCALFLQLCCLPAAASPVVEGYDLVSSTRLDRTNFAYVYSIRVVGDSSSYTNASFTVQSGSPTTNVTKSTVLIGNLDAGTFVRSTDTFTIKQDRTVAFDPTSLKFTFSGTNISGAPSAPVRIGPVVFLATAGRPVHEGSFPLTSADPNIGDAILLQASVYGSIVSASYSFVSSSGTTLVAGALSQVSTSLPKFVAPITVPAQPFLIQVLATASDGNMLAWTSSRLYTPTQYRLNFTPTYAILSKGESTTGSISLVSTTATGSFVVSLLLPTGFTGTSGPWTINLSPSQAVSIPINITAPTNGAPFQTYTISAVSVPTNSAGVANVSNVTFTVD